MSSQTNVTTIRDSLLRAKTDCISVVPLSRQMDRTERSRVWILNIELLIDTVIALLQQEVEIAVTRNLLSLQ